ncbi:hypothetical protein P7K49_039296 [Saguinus oedipus]|uniref:MAGE domain-containing protein n=1 Tax=Saguinus oedipus TaxID=9490 RepID=A0ABQ9THI1_SAGOE|nr:hypothetical protein P7K49_039296 [Saguinus oedipus]
MSLEQKSQSCKPEEGPKAQEEALGLMGAQAPVATSSSSTLVLGTLEDVPVAASQAKELVTKSEVLESVTKNYKHLFPVIFNKASESMQLVSGIDVKEVHPTSNTYTLVTCLGLSYDGLWLIIIRACPRQAS